MKRFWGVSVFGAMMVAAVLLAAVSLWPETSAGQGCPTWADAASRDLGDAELGACSCGQLDLLRNEIYARHGRIFNRDDLQRYFNGQSWYRPDPNNASGQTGQNRFEQNNAVRILNYEKRAGCRSGQPTPTRPATSACPAWPAPAQRRLTDNELAACSCRDLELLRNEIYARHGRIFNRDDLQRHFQAQSWYRPDASNPTGARGQNTYEQSNATRILNFEKKSGCKAGAAAPAPAPAPSSSCPTWADAQGRYLTDNDLAACSCQQLEILRNEIYARHGRIFNRADLQRYFNGQSWYRPDPNNSSGQAGQNSYERSNATRILNHEKARGCR